MGADRLKMSIRAARRRSLDIQANAGMAESDDPSPTSPISPRSPNPFWSKVTNLFSPTAKKEEESPQKRTDFYSAVYAHVVGNLATLCTLAFAYFLWLLFEAYFYALVWAAVFAIALFPVKSLMIESIHRGWSFLRQRQVRDYCRALLAFAFAYGLGCWIGGSAPLMPISLMLLVSCMLGLTLLPRPVHVYLLDDHTFSAIVIMMGTIIMSAVVIVFLFVQIQSEFAAATYSVATWIDHTMAQMHSTEEIHGVNVTEQVLNVRTMALEQLQQYQDSLNGTQWAPALRSVYNHLENSQHRGENLANVYQNWFDEMSKEENFSIRGVLTMAWDDVSKSDHLQKSLKEAGVNVASVVLGGLGTATGFAMLLLGLGTQAILFCTVLFYLLSDESSPLAAAFNFLPVPTDQRLSLLDQLEKSIERVLFLPVVVSGLNSMIGLGGITLTNALFEGELEFKFFCTFLISLFSMCPLVQPYLVPLPWALALLLSGKYVVAAVFFGGIYTAMTFTDAWVYEGSAQGIHPYFTALSIVLGLSAFGISGVVIGPLLLCVLRIVYDQVNHAGDNSRGLEAELTRARTASVWKVHDVNDFYKE